MKLYKLTDQDGMSGIEYNPLKWEIGVTHTAPGEGELCSAGWLHAYTDPLLAVLLNPIHANISNPRLWEIGGDIGKTDFGLKVGSTTQTVIRELPVPAITLTQRVAFGILCAKKACKDKDWNEWADKWLNGDDRSYSAALAARATWLAAALAAELASLAAALAAELAATAASVAALAAARATWLAETFAARAKPELDLIAIAREAVEKY